jgi:hypothetical protein
MPKKERPKPHMQALLVKEKKLGRGLWSPWCKGLFYIKGKLEAKI